MVLRNNLHDILIRDCQLQDRHKTTKVYNTMGQCQSIIRKHIYYNNNNNNDNNRIQHSDGKQMIRTIGTTNRNAKHNLRTYEIAIGQQMRNGTW